MKIRIIAVMLAAITLVGTASASTWKIDTNHSTIGFTAKHMMISTVRGAFDKYDATIEFDPQHSKGFRGDIVIDASSINTNNKKRDDHLQSPEFFDVVKFPKLTFKSKSLESLSGNRYRLVGDLTIRDVTREITLEGEGFSPQYKNPMGMIVTAVSATGKINREDFGLMWNMALESGGVLVSKEVTLELNLELVKGK